MLERFKGWLRVRRCRHEEWSERRGPYYDSFGEPYYREECLACRTGRIIQ